MRGIYTAGVLDVFLEEGISADLLVGVSAGAIHGCSFVSGQHGRSNRYYTKYCADPRFMSLRSLLTTGDMVGEQFCYHDLPDRLDPFDHDAFEASPMEYWVVCSDLSSGKAEYVRCRSLRGLNHPYRCRDSQQIYRQGQGKGCPELPLHHAHLRGEYGRAARDLCGGRQRRRSASQRAHQPFARSGRIKGITQAERDAHSPMPVAAMNQAVPSR